MEISAATIDRTIKPIRHRYKKRGLSETKPGSILKELIPIRTNQWDESRLGFVEADTGAHCGNSIKLKYFKHRKSPVDYTRSRAYHKNDNAHIEGKNWTLKRQYLGYERFENPKLVKLLNDFYTNKFYYFINFFLPSSKLLEKKRIGSKILKKYDKPQTPLERLLNSGR
ncbi:MAG: hypothetical protein ABI462_14305 [Ignavibacteria bacterium]